MHCWWLRRFLHCQVNCISRVSGLILYIYIYISQDSSSRPIHDNTRAILFGHSYVKWHYNMLAGTIDTVGTHQHLSPLMSHAVGHKLAATKILQQGILSPLSMWRSQQLSQDIPADVLPLMRHGCTKCDPKTMCRYGNHRTCQDHRAGNTHIHEQVRMSCKTHMTWQESHKRNSNWQSLILSALKSQTRKRACASNTIYRHTHVPTTDSLGVSYMQTIPGCWK